MHLKIGILGLGAIGHLVSAPLLNRSDIELYFFNRSPRNHFWFRPYQSPVIRARIACQTEPKPVDLDWLFICLKTYHYSAATPWFHSLIKPGVRVVVLRNGLGLTAPLLPYTSQQNILPALIDGPTQYNQVAKEYIQLKPAQLLLPEHPLSHAFAALFLNNTLRINIQADFKTASWEKLLESAGIGALTSLTGQPCRIFQQTELRELYTNLIKEGLAVARADGAQMAADYAARMLERLDTYPPEKGSSMLTDRLAGRPIEVMAKSGIISLKGKELGIPTPLHDGFSAILKQINR